MIRLLFHHRSRTIDVVEGLSVIAYAAVAWRITATGNSVLMWTLFALIMLVYAFIRYCASVRWYDDADRYEGIELQFKKAVAPTVYVLFVGGALFQLTPSAVLLLIVLVLLAAIAHVNAILLYLRWRDDQDMPVNYFSNNKFLRDASSQTANTAQSTAPQRDR